MKSSGGQSLFEPSGEFLSGDLARGCFRGEVLEAAIGGDDILQSPPDLLYWVKVNGDVLGQEEEFDAWILVYPFLDGLAGMNAGIVDHQDGQAVR
jgi:hypothetical protein